MIIDSHVHLSLYGGNAKTLLESRDTLLFEMKSNRIDYAIVIPDNIENDPHIADLDKALELTRGYDNFFFLGSPQIIQKGDSEINKYKELIENKKIVGLKFFPGHDPYFPTDKRCQAFYSLAQKLRCPVVFHTGENSDNPEVAKYNDPKYVVEVAEKFPNLKVIITHYYWPKIEYCYEITKNVPNIYFELAGTADKEVLSKSGGIVKMRQVLKQTIQDRPNQVIFGTDWPMCSLPDHLKFVRSLGLDKEIEQKILCTNAIVAYNLPINI